MWIVILKNQDGQPLGLVDNSDYLATFETKQEAEEAAQENLLAIAFGFKVYEF